MGESPRLYAGNLSYYLEKKAEERAAQNAAPVPPTKSAREKDEPGVNQRERRRQESQRRQERNRVLKPLQDKLAVVEGEIARLEEEKKILTQRMGGEGFGADAEEVRVLTARFAAVESEAGRAFTAWASASEELERAEAALAAAENAD